MQRTVVCPSIFLRMLCCLPMRAAHQYCGCFIQDAADFLMNVSKLCRCGLMKGMLLLEKPGNRIQDLLRCTSAHEWQHLYPMAECTPLLNVCRAHQGPIAIAKACADSLLCKQVQQKFELCCKAQQFGMWQLSVTIWYGILATGKLEHNAALCPSPCFKV